MLENGMDERWTDDNYTEGAVVTAKSPRPRTTSPARASASGCARREGTSAISTMPSMWRMVTS